MNIYKAKVSTPFGLFLVAVSSPLMDDARRDIKTAILTDMNCPYAMVKVSEINRSNRKLTKNMSPISKCVSSGELWAWVRRIS